MAIIEPISEEKSGVGLFFLFGHLKNGVLFLHTVKGGVLMTNENKIRISELVRQGWSYRKIATTLNISPNTVKSYFLRMNEGNVGACKECGAQLLFLPKRKKRKFCSDACRMSWWAKHPEERKPKAVYNYVCPVCGKAFIANGNPHRVYCSRQCSAKGRSQRYGKGEL